MRTFMILSILLATSAVSAQQSVTVTRYEYGEVVNIGPPIYDRVPNAQNCTSYGPAQPPRQHRNLNSGTVIGGIVGGITGSQIGGGSGRDAAIAIGAATGAVIGNDINRRQHEQDQQHYPPSYSCDQYESRVVGWHYTINVNGVLIETVTYGHYAPSRFQRVRVRVTSTFTVQ